MGTTQEHGAVGNWEEIYIGKCGKCRRDLNHRRLWHQAPVKALWARASWLSFRLDCEWVTLPVELTLNSSVWLSSPVWYCLGWLHSRLLSLFWFKLSYSFPHERKYYISVLPVAARVIGEKLLSIRNFRLFIWKLPGNKLIGLFQEWNVITWVKKNL